MKIARRKQETRTGIEVEGKAMPSIGAAVARAMQLALDRAPGDHVAVLEYGEVIGRAVRAEAAAVYVPGGGAPA